MEAVDRFAPGEYWTPQRAGEAARRASAALATPEMQAMMRAVADASAGGSDPASLAASMANVAPAAVGGDIRRESCVFRRGRAGDVPTLAALIVHGNLPPLFIQEFVEGFLVVEHEGELIGCGGNEIYGQSAVIRSVVVHERARGTGLGGEIARLLMDDARSFGARDLYLFTLDAHEFWLRIGFSDVPLDAWKDDARKQWQYQFCSRFPEAARDVYSMWSPA